MAVHFVKRIGNMRSEDLASVMQAFAPDLTAELSEPKLSKVVRALLLAEEVGCHSGKPTVDTASE
jgi:hypothetical protein